MRAGSRYAPRPGRGAGEPQPYPPVPGCPRYGISQTTARIAQAAAVSGRQFAVSSREQSGEAPESFKIAQSRPSPPSQVTRGMLGDGDWRSPLKQTDGPPLHTPLTPASMRLKCGSVGGPLRRGSLAQRRRHVHDMTRRSPPWSWCSRRIETSAPLLGQPD